MSLKRSTRSTPKAILRGYRPVASSSRWAISDTLDQRSFDNYLTPSKNGLKKSMIAYSSRTRSNINRLRSRCPSWCKTQRSGSIRLYRRSRLTLSSSCNRFCSMKHGIIPYLSIWILYRSASRNGSRNWQLKKSSLCLSASKRNCWSRTARTCTSSKQRRQKAKLRVEKILGRTAYH